METQILTKTEDQVIRLKLQGLSRKEIADYTSRSTGTIQRHFQNVYTKLNIQNEIELYNWYVENILDINIRNMLKVEKSQSLFDTSISL
ncbi:MAG TPA: helix-turn-helix transcriptional regulator [Prolixibacteraceae bacterium]|nr:helix-turn-helix transcriptional regulator [Prolixibacteraceae bacterium]